MGVLFGGDTAARIGTSPCLGGISPAAVIDDTDGYVIDQPTVSNGLITDTNEFLVTNNNEFLVLA